MSTTDNNFSTCANCGRDGNNLNICNKCKLVKYCNAACKKKHRSKHKKKCDRRVAELHDEALFKQPPQKDECPICFLRVPTLHTGNIYFSCCGKIICCGCIHAGATTGRDQLCPFCRSPPPILANNTDEEVIKRIDKRAELGDAQAIHNQGCHYDNGMYGLPQDHGKALELYHRAGELGNAASYYNIGITYNNGIGAERDEKKAKQYFELAAMRGNVYARHNLGCDDFHVGNYDRALKHFMIAVGSGFHGSLKLIKQLYSDGHATRDDYAKALNAYQAYLAEIKSDQRDKAAAFDDEDKYYE